MKISLLSLAIVSGLLFGSAALADNAGIAVVGSGSQTIGSSFTSPVTLNAAGNQVCVVKGTIVFTNLNCVGISVNSGLVAQTTPTCDSPSFTIGIPQCTADIKDL